MYRNVRFAHDSGVGSDYTAVFPREGPSTSRTPSEYIRGDAAYTPLIEQALIDIHHYKSRYVEI